MTLGEASRRDRAQQRHRPAPAARLAPRDLDRGERDDLAAILQQLLTASDDLFGFSLPHVTAIHPRPTGDGDWDPDSHVHIEFAPPTGAGTSSRSSPARR